MPLPIHNLNNAAAWRELQRARHHIDLAEKFLMNETDFFTKLRLANEDRQSEWDEDTKITVEYLGNAAAGELGEACNIIKKLARERMGLRGTRGNIDDLANELADVIIYLDLIAARFDIDLGNAIKAKFNATSEKYGLNTRII